MQQKEILRMLIYIIVFVNAFFLNVIIHEIGHYLAADYYELEPEIEFDFGVVGDLGFGLESRPIASTNFIAPLNKIELYSIVLMGPLMNLMLGIAVFFIFVFCKKEIIREVMIICFIISIASFIMNIVPISGTDGSLVFGF